MDLWFTSIWALKESFSNSGLPTLNFTIFLSSCSFLYLASTRFIVDKIFLLKQFQLFYFFSFFIGISANITLIFQKQSPLSLYQDFYLLWLWDKFSQFSQLSLDLIFVTALLEWTTVQDQAFLMKHFLLRQWLILIFSKHKTASKVSLKKSLTTLKK